MMFMRTEAYAQELVLGCLMIEMEMEWDSLLVVRL